MFSVLVIDDERMIRDMLKQVLSRVDFSVETADDAKGGIAKFDKGLFDLVITDIRMPDSDGFSVVHHIRNSKRQATPVIGVSGTPNLLSKGDFDDVLCKPFTIQALIDKAHALAQSRYAV